PTGVQVNMSAYDTTAPTALNATVLSFDPIAHTVTLSANATGPGVGSGDVINFLNPGIVYNITQSNFRSAAGVIYGSGTQGVVLNDDGFYTCSQGGAIIPANAVGLVQLTVTASQFGCSGPGIIGLSPVAGVAVIGNLFIDGDAVGTLYAIDFQQAYNTVIVGNSFGGAGVGPGHSLGIHVNANNAY